MIEYERLAIVLGLSIILAAATKKAGVLNNSGVASAFVIGVSIGVLGGMEWLFLLLVFLISGFAATKHSFAMKEIMGVQEGKKGERGWHNAWSTGLVPTAAAVLAFIEPSFFPHPVGVVVFVTAIAAGASDTFASEMGMLYKDPVMITSPSTRVSVGTNGGITPLGTLWALLAALHIGFWAHILFNIYPGAGGSVAPFWLLFGSLMGFVGCQIDSLLGALYENRGKLTKHGVNLISIGGASMISWIVLLVMT